MFFRSLVAFALVLAPAYAEVPLPGAATVSLPKHPERFVGKRVAWPRGFCFAEEKSFVCVGADEPFEVVATRIAPPTLAPRLKENCGGMDAIERNPFPQCAFSFSFTVGRYEPVIGDYVRRGELQSGAHLVRFHADVLNIETR